MGCKFACTCSGFCPGCSTYEPEEYVGHAEDVYARGKGYRNSDEYEQEYKG